MREQRKPSEGRRTYDHLALSLEKHLLDCEKSNLEQNQALASLAMQMTSLSEAIEPVVSIYKAGTLGSRVAVGLVKFLVGLGTLAGMFYAALRWIKGG